MLTGLFLHLLLKHVPFRVFSVCSKQWQWRNPTHGTPAINNPPRSHLRTEAASTMTIFTLILTKRRNRGNLWWIFLLYSKQNGILPRRVSVTPQTKQCFSGFTSESPDQSFQETRTHDPCRALLGREKHTRLPRGSKPALGTHELQHLTGVLTRAFQVVIKGSCVHVRTGDSQIQCGHCRDCTLSPVWPRHGSDQPWHLSSHCTGGVLRPEQEPLTWIGVHFPPSCSIPIYRHEAERIYK